MSVKIEVLTAKEALAKGWNLQPSFQRQTQPSQALKDALKRSANRNDLVFDVMLRNNEVGDGRKRMLVMKEWEEGGLEQLLNGAKVVVLDYDSSFKDFLDEFEDHNQINERMAAGELLNAEFHEGFPDEVKELIISDKRLHVHKRMQELSFLGCLLTGSEFNARTSDVLKEMNLIKGSITSEKVKEKVGMLIELSRLCTQIEVAARYSGVRKPTSKSDQATILRVVENYETKDLRDDEILCEAWIKFVEDTKDKPQRESKGDNYSILAEHLGLNLKKPAGSIKTETKHKVAGGA